MYYKNTERPHPQSNIPFVSSCPIVIDRMRGGWGRMCLGNTCFDISYLSDPLADLMEFSTQVRKNALSDPLAEDHGGRTIYRMVLDQEGKETYLTFLADALSTKSITTILMETTPMEYYLPNGSFFWVPEYSKVICTPTFPLLSEIDRLYRDVVDEYTTAFKMEETMNEIYGE